MAEDEIVAVRVRREIELDAAHPAVEWQNAAPVTYCTDWQGKNPDPPAKRRPAFYGRRKCCIYVSNAVIKNCSYSPIRIPTDAVITFGTAM